MTPRRHADVPGRSSPSEPGGASAPLELRVGGTRFCLHPVSPLALLALAKLGAPGEARGLLAALAVHEAGHLAMARALGVRVNALRLMPFGGAIDLGNPYALAPPKLLAVAAAGPLGNLLGVLFASALTQLGLLHPRAFLNFLGLSLALMLFNLLPALPLDGGRMLFALLSPRLGRDRAARLGIWAGRALAGALTALALLGWRQTGRLNLTALLASVFLVAAGPGELRALTDTRVRSLLSALRPVSAPVPARLYAVSAECPARSALGVAAPDAAALFAVYEGDRLAGFTDERALLTALARGGSPRAGVALAPSARAHYG